MGTGEIEPHEAIVQILFAIDHLHESLHDTDSGFTKLHELYQDQIQSLLSQLDFVVDQMTKGPAILARGPLDPGVVDRLTKLEV